MDFQTGDSVTDCLISSHLDIGSHLQERAGLVPLALLVEVLDALVDHELAVLRLAHPHPLERSRRRALEIDAALVEAAAVAGALELVLGDEPARRASEVGALREDRVDALGLAHDPHALVLLELRAHLPDREVGGKAGLERRRRLEEHPRERGADRRQERDAGEGPEDRPAEASEDVASRPQPSEARLGTCGLVALERLLDAALLGGCRLLLGGCWLSHGTRFLSNLVRARAELRLQLSPADQRGHDPPDSHDERHSEQHQPDRREEEHRGQGEDAEEEGDPDGVGGGCIRLRGRRRRRGRLADLRSVSHKLQGVFAKRRTLLGTRPVDDGDEPARELFDSRVELPLTRRRRLRHTPLVLQIRGLLRPAPFACQRSRGGAVPTRMRTSSGCPWRRTATRIAWPPRRRSSCETSSAADATDSPSTPVTTSARRSLRAALAGSTSVMRAPCTPSSARTSASSGVRSCSVSPKARDACADVSAPAANTASSTKMGRCSRRASARASLGRASSVTCAPPSRTSSRRA